MRVAYADVGKTCRVIMQENLVCAARDSTLLSIRVRRTVASPRENGTYRHVSRSRGARKHDGYGKMLISSGSSSVGATSGNVAVRVCLPITGRRIFQRSARWYRREQRQIVRRVEAAARNARGAVENIPRGKSTRESIHHGRASVRARRLFADGEDSPGRDRQGR